MTTNPFFRSSYQSTADQSLLQSLIIESIQIHGRDCYYVPRELVALDKIYGEDKLSAFNTAYKLEFYVDSFSGFGGDRDFISKFGLEIRDELMITVAKARFKSVVTNAQADIIRPREGDIVYFPLDRSLFEITFVENEQVFYQIGHLFTYRITCKKFELAGESFDTGVDDIDRVEQLSYSQVLTFTSGSGTYLEGEQVYQGADPMTADAAGEVVTWDGTTKELTVLKIKGKFDANTDTIGETSGATYVFTDTRTIEQLSNEPHKDNIELASEASDIVDDSELNPYLE